MPVIVMVLPSTLSCLLMALATVSVVIIVREASNHASASNLANASGKAASIFSTGNCMPITPVENGKTCCARQPASFATCSLLVRAARIPSSPVPAFALPALISK